MARRLSSSISKHMIKRLFALFVLVACAPAAWAMWGSNMLSNSTAPPPPPSGGGGGGGPVACDQGPNIASVPAPAAAVGFTKCALNADFTTNTTDANGINYSNTATYINGCGATSPSWRWYLLFVNFNTGAAVPTCAPAIVEFDASIGKQVLHLHDAAANGAVNNNMVEFEWPIGATPAISPLQSGLPFQQYNEITFRLSSDTLNQNPSLGYVTWDWWEVPRTDSPTGVTGFVEYDYIEINNTGPASSNIGDWPNHAGGGGSGFFTVNWTVYHTYGILVTSDGVSPTVAMCRYLDGVKTSPCATGTLQDPNVSNKVIDRYNMERMSFGCTAADVTVCPAFVLHDSDVYIQSIRVWECPTYKTTSCPTAVITTDNSPGEMLHKTADWIWDVIFPRAKADVFDNPHGAAFWICAPGNENDPTLPCVPLEMAHTKWWERCAVGRNDCVRSDRAVIGWQIVPGSNRELLVKRGAGYCYAGHPYTCNPEGVWPPH